eukprot:scaffold112109_cov28-Tisochrysis_lutea.AAC.4
MPTAMMTSQSIHRHIAGRAVSLVAHGGSQADTRRSAGRRTAERRDTAHEDRCATWWSVDGPYRCHRRLR